MIKKGFYAVFHREIKKILKMPSIIAIMTIVPLMLTFIVTQAFSTGVPQNLPIGVSDFDNSKASRQLIRMFEASPSLNVSYRPLNLYEGKKLIEEGKIYAYIVVPKDFNKDITRGQNPKIVNYFNNQFLLTGGLVSKEITTTARTFMAGVTIKMLKKRGIGQDQALSKVNLISVDDHILSNPSLNYFYFLALATIPHILQILIAFVSAYAVGLEFKDGTALKWLKMSKGSIFIAVFAKLAPYFLIFALVTLSLLSFIYGYYKIPILGNSFFLIISTLLFILSYQLIPLIFIAIGANLRFALSSCAFYTSLGFTFAGVTFPVMAMPPFAKFYSSLLPLKHYMSILLDQTIRGISPIYSIKPFLFLMGLMILPLLFFSRLKKLAYDPKQWGKS